jgi:hypothetical protein
MVAARVSATIFSYIWNGCINWLFFGPRLDLYILRQGCSFAFNALVTIFLNLRSPSLVLLFIL